MRSSDKPPVIGRRGALALALMLPGAARARAAGSAAPARLRVSLPAGQGDLPLYASPAWDAPAPDVTRAVVLIHGRGRNAATYWRHLRAAAARANAPDALLLAPHFLASADMAGLDPALLHWSASGWTDGAPAQGPAPLSSFDALDALLARLSDAARFPRLETIVLAGHSAGGQLVQRYAVLGAAATPGRALRFVVMNPSSYAYFSPERPFAGCVGDDDWKYGMNHLPPYAAAHSAADAEARYAARQVVYLLGTADTDPAQAALDKTCAAEAQGPNRFVRGQAYFASLQARHGAALNQRLVEVPGVAHQAGRMVTAPEGLRALFGP